MCFYIVSKVYAGKYAFATSGKNVVITTNAKIRKNRNAMNFFPATSSRPTRPANAYTKYC